MSEEAWDKKRAEFWRMRVLHEPERGQDGIECRLKGVGGTLISDSRAVQSDLPSVQELVSYVDCYNPHGAYHYGGSLPLTPLQQTPSVLLKASPVWRHYHYAAPTKLTSFLKLYHAEVDVHVDSN